MFARILIKSIVRRKKHIALALAAVIVGTSVVAALFSVFSDVHEKMNRELRRYGANMVVLPSQLSGPGQKSEGAQISPEQLEEIAGVLQKAQIVGWAPFSYHVVTVNGEQQAVLVGTDLEAVLRVNPYLRINGRSPQTKDETRTLAQKCTRPNKASFGGVHPEHTRRPRHRATSLYGEGSRTMTRPDSGRFDQTFSLVAGIEAAQKLGLKIGNRIILSYGASEARKEQAFWVAGFIQSGSSEDNQLFAKLASVRNLVASGSIDVIQASVIGGLRSIEQLRQDIQRVVPQVRVEPVLKITKSEGQLLNRLTTFTFIATFIILTIATFSAMATIQSLITERRAEIGLMKALGAGNNNIIVLFLSEAGFIGLVGGLIGFGIGAALAQAVGQSVFGAAINLSLVGFILVMLIGLLIAVFGVLFFIKYVTEIEPANTLRGE